jgi:hypothetical protein
MFSAANKQIVAAYDSLGMTIDEIAEQFECDAVAVKSCLLQFSTKFKTEHRAVETRLNVEFTPDEQFRAKEVIVHLMDYAEDPYLQSRMARYIRDDSKGRLDIENGVKQMNVNITLFQDTLRQAQEARRKALENKPAIDVETVGQPEKEGCCD